MRPQLAGRYVDWVLVFAGNSGMYPFRTGDPTSNLNVPLYSPPALELHPVYRQDARKDVKGALAKMPTLERIIVWLSHRIAVPLQGRCPHPYPRPRPLSAARCPFVNLWLPPLPSVNVVLPSVVVPFA